MRSNKETYNQRLFLLFFLFTTLSGAIRKWGVSNTLLDNLILVIQLVLPFGLVVLMKKEKTLSRSIRVLLTAYALCLLAMVFNPLNLTYFHGVLGFILHFGFWVAIFYAFRNIQVIPLERLLPVVFFFILLELILGGLQYTLPGTHFLNRFASESGINITHVGDAVRAAGTFSYIGGYGAFIAFAGYYLWSLSVANRPRWIQLVIFVMGIMMALFSGSRAPMAIFLGLGLLSFFPRITVGSILGAVGGFFLLSVAVIQFSDKVPIFSRAVENLESRINRGIESGEQNSRILSTIEEIVHFKGDYPVFGTGLGATYQGAKRIWGESVYVQQYGYYEEEPERIILEGGFILYFFKITLILILFGSMRIPIFLKIPLSLFHFFFFPIVFNIFQAAYLLLGLVAVERAYYLRDAKLV